MLAAAGRCCVASSSDPAKLRLSLDVTGLLPLFDGHVFSAAQVSRGKPAPDLFLYAADRMGVAPARCVVPVTPGSRCWRPPGALSSGACSLPCCSSSWTCRFTGYCQ